MDINGMNYTTATATSKTTTASNATTKKTTNKPESLTLETTASNSGVVYQQSDTTKSVNGLYTPNTALVNQMKTDSQNRLNQLQDLVYKLISKQGSVANHSQDIWKLLQKGDITVDQETADAAKEEISEDGYWGVTQTSDRIVSFAKALTGGDPSKIDAMQKAFEQGYKEATKAWGKELPAISSKTYDAVIEKFKAWREESSISSKTNDVNIE